MNSGVVSRDPLSKMIVLQLPYSSKLQQFCCSTSRFLGYMLVSSRKSTHAHHMHFSLLKYTSIAINVEYTLPQFVVTT